MKIKSTSFRKVFELGNVEKLIKKLTDSKAETRKLAAIELGKLGDLQAVEPLIIRLNDDDESVRMWAAAALGKLGDERGLEPLVKVVMQDSEIVKKEAARAVAKIVPSFDDVNIDVVIQKIEGIYQEFAIDQEREQEIVEIEKELKRETEKELEKETQEKVFDQIKEVQIEQEAKKPIEKEVPLETLSSDDIFPKLDEKYAKKRFLFNEALCFQFADGKHNIEEISEESLIPIVEVEEIIEKYKQKGWIEIFSKRQIEVKKEIKKVPAEPKPPPPPIEISPAATIRLKEELKGPEEVKEEPLIGFEGFMAALKKQPIDDRVEEISDILTRVMGIFVTAIDDIQTRLGNLENFVQQKFQILEAKPEGVPAVFPSQATVPQKGPELKPPKPISTFSTRAALNEELKKVLLKRKIED
ncbi:MAG: HEAT repeat domain-containing protein [Candidatus Helarchaeota archaeon]|nr:HEAT repeat domain-containing protein [Candidatus Helarchaeota archaeon]